MLRLVSLFLLTLLGSGQAGAAVKPSAEAVLDEKLRSTVQSYSLSAQNLLQALARASDDFGLRMGIEWEVASIDDHPVALRYAKITPLQVLEDLLATEPSYALSVANGVVHVSRKTLIDDKRNFLNLHIEDFDAPEEYVFHASNRLHQIVYRLANQLTEEDPRTGCGGSFAVGSGDHLATLHLHDSTVRDILDKFVVSAGFNIWLVTFPETKTITPRGFFRTLSMDGSSLSEDLVPMWYLLTPGHDPVGKGFGVGWPRSEWPPVGKIK
jgi:hypothetical protein